MVVPFLPVSLTLRSGAELIFSALPISSSLHLRQPEASTREVGSHRTGACARINWPSSWRGEGHSWADTVKGNSSRELAWGALDDVVMGGVSQSSFPFDPSGGENGGCTGLFKGAVSTANNGGFTSIRTKVRIPFSSLRPIFRARTMSDAPPFDPSNIISLQLMFSKFEYDGKLNPTFVEGAFQLPV